ncbi:hypothetical protein [Legionella fairfieldensis]|uniref:hypothetical protein n=1 Tax=Legionella fairfieldensis TaxID=45064 RepID=UPI000561D104|nr:hypothetical protein [Legionella fairfieldensis]
MEIRCTVPHTQFLEALFAFKSKVSSVFRDVLGLYEINHIAITQINKRTGILTFSSTPAIEFNLFNSNLWLFDKTYHPDWFGHCSQANWQTLYATERYDELYYIKQLKHRYSIGYSLAAKWEDDFFIYSLASNRSCKHTEELFANQHENFYKIGQYCSNMLSPLFMHYSACSEEA